jgi:hypothetical protein
MKCFAVITVLLALALAPGRAQAQTVTGLQVGEKLTYNIYWGLLIIGRATLEVKGIEKVDGHDCYHLVAHAQTTGLGDLLYRVRSTAESWLDVNGLFSRKYSENRSEGKNRHNDEIVFDYERKQTIVRNPHSGNETRLPLEGAIHDALSLLYTARLQPLGLHEEKTYALNAGKTNYSVTMKPDEQRQIKARAVGSLTALRIEPKPTLKILSRNGGRMWVWVSNDERRLPLLAISTMKLGSARLELTEVHPPLLRAGARPAPKTNFGPARPASP